MGKLNIQGNLDIHNYLSATNTNLYLSSAATSYSIRFRAGDTEFLRGQISTSANGTTHGTISGLYLFGPTYGNTTANIATAGKLSIGDPGPQIIFNCYANLSDGQPLALIYSDNDSIATGNSLSLVSSESNCTFIAPTIKALTKFIGTLDGNASTATKLKTARTISLTGSVTGSGSFDGSGNLSIATTTNHSHSYLPLSGGTLTGAAAINFPAGSVSVSASTPMSLSYGRLACYGTLYINANTDNSGDEYVVITAGKGLSSSNSDGLAIGSSSLTWQGSTVLTTGNFPSSSSLARQTDMWISAASLDVNTYYPVVISLPANGLNRIKLAVQLNSSTKPSWSTHNGGFTSNIDVEIIQAGWGTVSPLRYLLRQDDYSFSSVKPAYFAGQLSNASLAVFYVRGGGSYRFICDWADASISLRTSSTTYNEQTVAPTTSASVFHSGSKSHLYCNVDYASSAGNVAWGNISEKPSTFTPSSHGHNNLSALVIDDNLAYSAVGTHSGGGSDYDKALLSTLCSRYPNYGGNFSGRYWPNSYGFLLGNIYNTSTTSGGLPQYSTFIGSSLGDPSPHIFGTSSYNYYAYTLLTSGNYSSYALPLSGGTMSGNIVIGSNFITGETSNAQVKCHGLQIGYPNHDYWTFSEWGGLYHFYKYQTSGSTVTVNTLCGSINEYGWVQGPGGYGSTFPSAPAIGQVFYKT